MPLVGFHAGDPLARSRHFVKPLGLRKRFAGAFDGKEIEAGSAQQRGQRRSQRQEAGMIDAFADEAEDVLLRVGIGSASMRLAIRRGSVVM